MRRLAGGVISSLVALGSVEAALRIVNRGYGNEPLLPDAVLHHAHRNYQFLNSADSLRRASGPAILRPVPRMSGGEGHPFVDLVPAFARAQAEGRPMFFARDIHWTEQGHAVAGNVLCRALGTEVCR